MLKTTNFSTASVWLALKATYNSSFITVNAKLAFILLRQTFTKSPIFHDFDQKHYICNETDVFGYAICGIVS